MAADKIIVVLDPGIFALESVETLQNSFGEFLRKLGLKLKIDMALITKCPRPSLFRRNYAKDIKKDTENLINSRVFMIPYSDLIYHTHIWGLPISHLKPRSKIGRVYDNIARQILEEAEIKQKLPVLEKRLNKLNKIKE